MSRTPRKTETLTVRISPEVKDALRSTALAERRSLANAVEIAILDYYKKCANGNRLAATKARVK
jgi:hypothetical protein